MGGSDDLADREHGAGGIGAHTAALARVELYPITTVRADSVARTTGIKT